MAYTAIYTSANLGDIVIDVIGAFLQGIVANATLLVTLTIVLIVVGLALDLMTGIFGIFRKLKGAGK